VWITYLPQYAVVEVKLTARVQDAQKVFEDALAGDDVEKNDKGEIALHGVTYLFWTSKVPS
jgi:hypothetical protein